MSVIRWRGSSSATTTLRSRTSLDRHAKHGTFVPRYSECYPPRFKSSRLRSRLSMDDQQIRRRRQEESDRHGEWTAHKIRLADDTYTFSGDHPDRDRKTASNALHLNRILQAVSDAAG